MRGLVLLCAIVSTVCLAIPLESPANSVIQAGKEPLHVDTPHLLPGSLREDTDIENKRAMMPDSGECLLSTKIKKHGVNNCGNTYKPEGNCFSSASKFRLVSRKHLSQPPPSHDSSGLKGHQVNGGDTHSKAVSGNANDAHWFRQADYRRSPLLGLQPGEVKGHHGVSPASINSVRVEPTYTSSSVPKRTERPKEYPHPTQSQGEEGNHANRWGGQNWDWKQ